MKPVPVSTAQIFVFSLLAWNLLEARSLGNLNLFWIEHMEFQVGIIFLVGPAKCVEPEVDFPRDQCMQTLLLSPHQGFATMLKMAPNVALAPLVGQDGLGHELYPAHTLVCNGSASLFYLTIGLKISWTCDSMV